MSLVKSINEAQPVKSILNALSKKRPSFSICIAGSLLGGITIGVLRWIWRNKKHKEQLSKDEHVDLEAVHTFWKKIQESPLLYPYFMHIKVEKRENVMQKIACSIHEAVGQAVVTPQHQSKLHKIHCKLGVEKLGVDEKAYAEFTQLFSHICCNKSDTQRAKMLKTFAQLQKYICTGAVNQANTFVDFFKLPGSGSKSRLCNSDFGQQKQTVGQIQGLEGLVDSEHGNDAWGERVGEGATVKQLYKQISDLEKVHDYLVKVNKALDARMKVLESNHMAINSEN